MQQSIKCPICQSASPEFQETLEGYKQGEKYDILECKICNTSFANPFKTSSDIYQLIYEHPEETPGYNRYYRFANEVLKKDDPLNFLALSEGMYWAVKDTLENRLPDKKSSILEVGCGLGYLTYSINVKGYKNIIGVDISANAINKAKQSYGDLFLCKNVFDMEEEYANHFDCIILTEVIEHVESPVDFIKCLHTLLKKDGILLITTPNKSIRKNYSNWDTELPPVHLSWFSEESFITIANMLGCSYSFVDFTKFTEDFFYIHRYKFYQPKTITYTFDKDGKLAKKGIDPSKSPVIKFTKKLLLGLSKINFLDKLLTLKQYPKSRSFALAVVFKK